MRRTPVVLSGSLSELRQSGSPVLAQHEMVNVMLLRIHHSGHSAEISKERLALVDEGIHFYKKIRKLGDLHQTGNKALKVPSVEI
ncbi:hypothetical protein M0651_16225 [Paenibacillus sp. MBLB2552]|uniref:Uncharacterized protein n=1 Tax=Paenibacillus mellifer TaxID=2937794 RepID=A0A9X1XZC0_9BACL|nr:hypothetical protein [Paenibacillus mellifer]MCK8488725.1 hypothetical protein [Paenibacillus mellifer]